MTITWELAKMHPPGTWFRKSQAEPEHLSVFLTSTLGNNDTNQSLRTTLVNQYFLTGDMYQNHLKIFFFFFDVYLLGLTPGNTSS